MPLQFHHQASRGRKPVAGSREERPMRESGYVSTRAAGWGHDHRRPGALRWPGLRRPFPGRPGDEVLPWLDQPTAPPVPDSRPLEWEQLDSYLTPNDRFFTVAHYGQPAVDAATWRLAVGGLVARRAALTLDDLRARPRQEVVFTLECSGNHGFPWSPAPHRHRPLGGHAAGPAAGGGRRPRGGPRGRVLGRRRRRGDGPRASRHADVRSTSPAACRSTEARRRQPAAATR